MPYTKSLARKDFCKQTEQILQICRISSRRTSLLPDPVIDMIFQAAIFKTSALLEEYLKNAISDWLFRAINNGHRVSSLPDELKWFCITRAHGSEYEKFSSKKDEYELINNLKQKPQNKLFDNSSILTGLLNPSTIVSDRKYPSIKNIKRLFIRIGITNIFDKVNRRSRRQLDHLLQSFLDIREAIAHQSPPTITHNDIHNHISNVQCFVYMIDKELSSHVHKCHDTQCWRTT